MQVLEQGAIAAPSSCSPMELCVLHTSHSVSVLFMLAQSLQCHLDVTSMSFSTAPEHSREERQELQVATVTPAPPPFASPPGKYIALQTPSSMLMIYTDRVCTGATER